MKGAPVLMIMFSVVILSASILGIASVYGETDWTWIAQQVALFSMIIMVFGVAVYGLKEWLR